MLHNAECAFQNIQVCSFFRAKNRMTTIQQKLLTCLHTLERKVIFIGTVYTLYEITFNLLKQGYLSFSEEFNHVFAR